MPKTWKTLIVTPDSPSAEALNRGYAMQNGGERDTDTLARSVWNTYGLRADRVVVLPPPVSLSVTRRAQFELAVAESAMTRVAFGGEFVRL